MTHLQTDRTIERDAIASRVDDAPASAARSIPSAWVCDPLEEDELDDEMVVTTSRRLLRLAIAATDVGVRFTRDGLKHDPAAWMITARDLFGGRSAMDACQELEHFRRSIVLNGLGIGLDAAPEDVDALLADDAADDDVHASGSDGAEVDASDVRLPGPHLLTCWVDLAEPEARVFAFCAVVTDRPADLVERIVGRYGAEAASQARFAAGFDHTTPLATAMISDAMADTLALAAADPGSPLAAGLDVMVEQRFLA